LFVLCSYSGFVPDSSSAALGWSNPRHKVNAARQAAAVIEEVSAAHREETHQKEKPGSRRAWSISKVVNA